MKNIWNTIPRWVKIVAAVLAVLFVVAFFAIGWYFSSKVITLTPQKVQYDQRVTSVKDDVYTFEGAAYDINGIVGAIHKDGTPAGIFKAPTNLIDATKTSSRTVSQKIGSEPVTGEDVSLQGNIWITDPKAALGLDYSDITYQSQLGAMNAWLIPGEQPDVWTIAVHGIGADKQEMLRFIKPVHDAGSTMMVINYRGDTGNPKSPDGYTHLGDTEWKDLESAVAYAKAHGATTIQIYADSLGGSVAENYLRRSTDTSHAAIRKVVLDSPALDWNEILNYRITKLGYPKFLAVPGKTVSTLRTGINFGRITTKPGSIRQPTLIIHNVDDKSVPQAASKRVAAAQPELVTFVDFGAGGHIRAWNHDQARYEKLVTEYLKN